MPPSAACAGLRPATRHPHAASLSPIVRAVSSALRHTSPQVSSIARAVSRQGSQSTELNYTLA